MLSSSFAEYLGSIGRLSRSPSLLFIGDLPAWPAVILDDAWQSPARMPGKPDRIFVAETLWVNRNNFSLAAEYVVCQIKCRRRGLVD